jgi:hypothetical protein
MTAPDLDNEFFAGELLIEPRWRDLMRRGGLDPDRMTPAAARARIAFFVGCWKVLEIVHQSTHSDDSDIGTAIRAIELMQEEINAERLRIQPGNVDRLITPPASDDRPIESKWRDMLRSQDLNPDRPLTEDSFGLRAAFFAGSRSVLEILFALRTRPGVDAADVELCFTTMQVEVDEEFRRLEANSPIGHA